MHLAAQSPALEGFLYGDQAAPTGKEWEAVEECGIHDKPFHFCTNIFPNLSYYIHLIFSLYQLKNIIK